MLHASGRFLTPIWPAHRRHKGAASQQQGFVPSAQPSPMTQLADTWPAQKCRQRAAGRPRRLQTGQQPGGRGRTRTCSFLPAFARFLLAAAPLLRARGQQRSGAGFVAQPGAARRLGQEGGTDSICMHGLPCANLLWRGGQSAGVPPLPHHTHIHTPAPAPAPTSTNQTPRPPPATMESHRRWTYTSVCEGAEPRPTSPIVAAASTCKATGSTRATTTAMRSAAGAPPLVAEALLAPRDGVCAACLLLPTWHPPAGAVARAPRGVATRPAPPGHSPVLWCSGKRAGTCCFGLAALPRCYGRVPGMRAGSAAEMCWPLHPTRARLERAGAPHPGQARTHTHTPTHTYTHRRHSTTHLAGHAQSRLRCGLRPLEVPVPAAQARHHCQEQHGGASGSSSEYEYRVSSIELH